MPEKIEYDDEELYNSLIVPGQCHHDGADVGLSDVPAWTSCQPCATTAVRVPYHEVSGPWSRGRG